MHPFQSYHANLRMNGRCPVCSTPYDLSTFRILAERDQHVLAYIACPKCGSGVLSLLTVQPQGMQAVGLVTDLTGDEVADVERGDAISTDDVIAVHDLLERDAFIPPAPNDNATS